MNTQQADSYSINPGLADAITLAKTRIGEHVSYTAVAEIFDISKAAARQDIARWLRRWARREATAPRTQAVLLELSSRLERGPHYDTGDLPADEEKDLGDGGLGSGAWLETP